jgi:hypothetical protein
VVLVHEIHLLDKNSAISDLISTIIDLVAIYIIVALFEVLIYRIYIYYFCFEMIAIKEVIMHDSSISLSNFFPNKFSIYM